MTTEQLQQLRIKVAELLGIPWWSSSQGSWMSVSEDVYVYHADGLSKGRQKGKHEVLWDRFRIPHYPSDLNACAEMRKGMTRKQYTEYGRQLTKILAIDNSKADATSRATWDATADQYCRAFVATMENEQ